MLKFLQDMGKPKIGVSRETLLDLAVAEFGIEKRNFDGSSTSEIASDVTIQLLGVRRLPKKGIHNDCVVIPEALMRDWFQMILDQILKMNMKR